MLLKKTRSDKLFDILNYTLLSIILLTVLYPLYFICIASISNPVEVYQGNVKLLPKGITLNGYQRIFNEKSIWIGYQNSLLYAVVGTFINITLTLTGGYVLSRKDLPGRNIFAALIVFTMFFNGGLIPRYLIVMNLGWINKIWAMVIPNAINVFNLIVARTFFQTTIPDELLEAAEIDGCSDFQFFIRIVLPLSKAITAVLILYYGVAHWNAYFDALIYLREESKYPLQIILRNILIANEMQASMAQDAETVSAQQKIADLIKYGVIIVSTLPLLILYPFLQRYFVKGVMIGAIKG